VRALVGRLRDKPEIGELAMAELVLDLAGL
jgi:hypothetical protein